MQEVYACEAYVIMSLVQCQAARTGRGVRRH